MIISRKQPDLKFEISDDEAQRIFDTMLGKLAGEYFIKGDKLYEEVTGSHRFDIEVLPHELGGNYDVVFAACRLESLLKARASLKALAK